MTYLVGIDLGSQSAKVVVHDADGQVVSEGRQPLRPTVTPRPGVVEHPDDDLWDALGAASRAAMGAFDGDPAEIAGVGLCGVRFCRALLRADGTLAAPVLSWMDARVSRPHEPRDPDVRRVTSSSGYLTHRLTGRFVDSAAAYQGQWPIDTATWRWLDDAAALAAFGVPREQLVDLVQPGDVLGEVTADAAALTGLPAGLPVVATANDKAVEALGSGLRSSDEVLLSLGTYVAAMTVGDRRVRDAEASWTNFASTPGAYLHESEGVRRGMWTVTWLRDLLGEELVSRAAAEGTTLEQLLEDGAASVPPGSDGLLTVLDWLAPSDQPHRRGAFVGFDGRQGPFHLYRSVLEGLVMTMHRHLTAMTAELGTEPHRVVVSGGGARSDVVLQLVADVFGLPAVRRRGSSAAALGAAVCAAVATGVHPSFDAAVDAMVADAAVAGPDASRLRLYGELEDAHRELTDALAPALRRTHRLLG